MPLFRSIFRASLFLVAALSWSQDFILISRHRQGFNGQPAATQSQLQLLSKGGVLSNATSGPGVGHVDGARALGSNVLIQQKGITYLVRISEVGRLEVQELNATQTDFTIVTGPTVLSDTPRGLLTTLDRNTVFILTNGGASGNFFRRIWKLDTSNLPNIAAPVLAGSVPATENCTDAVVTPDGKRALFVCPGSTNTALYDLDLSGTLPVTATASALTIPGSSPASQIEIEPTKGTFAYVLSENGNATPVDLTGSNPTLKSVITGGNPGGLRFHPSGKWAYVIPPGGGGIGSNLIRLLDSTSGPASAYTVATTFGVFARFGYDILLGGDRAYFLGTWNGNLDVGNPLPAGTGGWVVLVYDINQTNGVLTLNPTVNGGKAIFLMGSGNSSPQGAILPVYPVTVNTNLDTTLLDPDVGIDNIGTAVDEYLNPNVPLGQVTVSAPATVPEGTDIEWRLTSWSVDGTVDPTMSNNPKPPVDVVAPGGKTYTANYEKWVKITFDNQGCSVVNNSTGFFKLGSDPLLHVEAVANGTIVSLEFFPTAGGGPITLTNDTPLAITEPGTVKTTCNPPAPPGTPVTLLVNPPFLSTGSTVLPAPVTVSITGGATSAPAPWTGNVPGTSQTLSVSNPSPEIPNHTRYTFGSWAPSGTNTATLPNDGTPTTFTANYTPVAYFVNVVNNGCPASAITWTSPAGFTGNAYVPAGTNLFATFPSVTSATVESIDPFTGNFGPAFPATALTMLPTGPVRLTLNCSPPPPSNFSVTLNGAGPGCNATLSSAGLSGPSYPANSPITINMPSTGLSNVQVTINNVTTTYTSFPATFTLTGNATVRAECNSPATACIAQPANLIGWYPIDGPQVPFADLIAPAAQMTTQNGGVAASGKVAGGFDFLFASGFLTAGNPAKYNFGTGDFAVSGWFKMTAPNAGPYSIIRKTDGNNGFDVRLNNGRLRLELTSGAATTTWNGAKSVNDLNWHHVVVNVGRTSNTLQFIVDGQLDTVTGPALSTFTGNINSGQNFTVAGFNLVVDEIQVFNQPVSISDAQKLFLADSFGVCKPAVGNVNVTVITNPPNVQAEVGIAGNKTAGLHQASLPASSTQTLTAQDPFLNTDGNYYRFNNWTPSGPGVTLPATGNIIYTANYTLAGYQVDASGCGITVGPAARQISANPLVFSTGGTLTLGATPPSGQVFQNFIVSPLVGGGATTTFNTNPANIPFTGPVKIVANCGAATAVPITLISAPQASGPTLTLTFTGTSGTPITSGPAAGPRSINIPGGTTAGSLTLQAQPQFVGSGTGYNFNNFTPGVPVGNPAVVAAIPTTATTYTANYTPACYVLTLEPTPAAGGTATINPASGNVAGFPANCYAPGTNVTLTTQPNTGYTHNSFGGPDIVNTGASTTTFAMNGPKNVKIFFDTVVNHAVTVTTSPTGLTFAVDGTPSTTPVSVQWPALSIHKLEVTTPQLLAGSYYAFNRWTIAAGTVSNLAVYPNASVSKPENYTGVFDLLCHVLTVNASGGTVTRNPATGVSSALANCYAPGTQVTLTAAGTGTNTLTGWSGDATGTTPTVTVTMNGPKTVTATFGAPSSVTLTVVTVPAGLDARIGTTGAFAPAPVSASVTANTSVPVAVTDPIVSNGTGYRFINWTPGGPLPGNSAGGASAAVGTTNLTVTANFTALCYILTTNAAPAGGGTVSANPASGNTFGFPTNCYQPGTVVTLTAAPATGRSFTNWTGDASGTSTSVQVTMSGPKTVTANFGTPTTVAVVVNTTPPGLLIRVDNVQLTAPQTFNWTAGSSHSLAVVTPQAGATGVRQAWLSWSQGGAQAQTITTPNAPTTYTANFRTQYLVTTGTIPAFTGDLRVNTNPAPSDNYFDAGSSVSFTAAGTGNGAYSFGAWQGAITSSANPASLTINAPVTVTAVFDTRLQITNSLSRTGTLPNNVIRHSVTLSPNFAVTNMVVTGLQFGVVTGTGSVANTTSLPVNIGTLAAAATSAPFDVTGTIPTTVVTYSLTITVTATNAAGRTQTWSSTWPSLTR
jgi:hypothetical protein